MSNELAPDHKEILAQVHETLKEVLEHEANAKLARAKIEKFNADLVRLGGPSQICW